MSPIKMFVRLVIAMTLATETGWAQTPTPRNGSSELIVRIVAAESPDRLVSDLEAIAAVGSPAVNTSSRLGGVQPASSAGGDDATMWVKGARVDGTNTFERYHKGEYTYRKSELTFAAGRLTEGEHVIDPGRHVFRIDKDGNLSSSDPDIVIEGRTVSLKAYRIDFMSVDGNLTGPPEVRQLARVLNVEEIRAGSNTVSVLGSDKKKLTEFCPLRLYLPAHTNDAAYVLRPGDQRFRVLPGGTVELQGKANPVITAEGSKLILSYRSFFAWLRTKTGIGASFGGDEIPVTDTEPARIRVGPVVGEPMFLASTGGLSKTFGLQLSGDMDKYPYKFMVVENMRDPMALRMMALESGACVFERGNSATVRLQFKENTSAPADVARPRVQLFYSAYNPVHWGSRSWTPCDAVEKWEGDILTFKTPDVPYGFYMFRVVLFGPHDKDSISPLTAEFPVCVIEPKQDGTLAFVSNKGRDAFVQGETIRLEAVFRSKGARPAGNRTVVLKHPDGREDRLPIKDAGGK
ncbi:MAG: hypothetical protein ACOYOU_14760 [Kiritimatiellia bacterium]